MLEVSFLKLFSYVKRSFLVRFSAVWAADWMVEAVNPMQVPQHLWVTSSHSGQPALSSLFCELESVFCCINSPDVVHSYSLAYLRLVGK